MKIPLNKNLQSAIGEAREYAKMTNSLIYIYKIGYNYFADKYNGEDWIAKCWPGGRSICRKGTK